MALNTVKSQGSTFKIGSNKVGGITNFSGLGGGSSSVIDVTDLDSVAMEKNIGLPDEGTFSITCNVLQADVGQIALRAARSAGTLSTFTQTVGTKIRTFSGYVLKAAESGGKNEVLTVAFDVEISGPVVETNASV